MQAAQLDDFLKKNGSPLAGYGNVFLAAGRKYGVDPRLLVAISGAESSYGKIPSGAHNPFGWGPGINFGSWGDAIYSVAKGLRNGYLDQGLSSVSQIGSKWAPVGADNDPNNLNSYWERNVSAILKQLGGSGGSSGADPVLAVPQSVTGPSPVTTGALQDQASQNLAQIGGGQFDPIGQLDALVQQVAAGRGPGPANDAALRVPVRGEPKGSAPGSRVARIAARQLGQDYVWGGESRKEGGFDCSGLIQWAYSKLGVSIPRTTYEQIKVGRAVKASRLLPGDLVFFNGGSHVVMYVGGGRVIAAPHTGTVVQYQNLKDLGPIYAARRIL